MDRIQFISIHGKKILEVDLANCSPAELEQVLRTVPDYVTSQPFHSVLLLADFTNTWFDKEAIRLMQETTTFDKAYIKKSAWIGTKNLPDSFREEVSKFSHREFPVFKTRAEALEWLVGD
jgi:hypothetical protein